MILSKNKSMVCYQTQPAAAIRLICFPCAGAGASMYRRWAPALPGVEVWAANYPGRESLHAMPLAESPDDIIAAYLHDMAFWQEKPFVLFGHSFGAMVSFMTALALQQTGCAPAAVMVSARRAPHLAATDSYHDLSDHQFLARLDAFGGIPAAIRHDPEMMAFYLPVIRADLSVNDNALTSPDEAIAAPLYLFSARNDGVATVQELAAWKYCTSGSFVHREFDGGHFFIQEQQERFLAALRAIFPVLLSENDEALIAF